MKVTLISSTPDAVDLLIFTKQTRLNMRPGLLEEIKGWPQEKKLEELQYMARTIRSSWEFVDFTFVIEGVTRAIAQQITRTRTASFAMQSMRVPNGAKYEIENPFKLGDASEETAATSANTFMFDRSVDIAQKSYDLLVENGATAEDARGILPLNTKCNIVAKYNLRTLVDVITKRESLRAQGPYAFLAGEFKRLVLATHPEFECFFADPRAEAFAMLETVAKDLGITPGAGAGWEIGKAIDLLKQES